jgi:hypothetical protein
MKRDGDIASMFQKVAAKKAQEQPPPNRHIVYDLIYLLLKLISILPVATSGVERVFSAMNFIKNKLRNRMGDSALDDCLLTFTVQDIFMNVKKMVLLTLL